MRARRENHGTVFGPLPVGVARRIWEVPIQHDHLPTPIPTILKRHGTSVLTVITRWLGDQLSPSVVTESTDFSRFSRVQMAIQPMTLSSK